MPFIQRLSEIKPCQTIFTNKDENEQIDSTPKVYLDLFELPEDEDCEIDLKQAAVCIMAHLDRLASPHIPPLSFNKVRITNYSKFISKKEKTNRNYKFN